MRAMSGIKKNINIDPKVLDLLIRQQQYHAIEPMGLQIFERGKHVFLESL